MEKNKVFNDDCLKLMANIKDKSVNCVICDLPYGTTAATWDKTLPMSDYLDYGTGKRIKRFSQDTWFLWCYENNFLRRDAVKIWQDNKQAGLWSHYERIIKDDGAIVLFGSEPFATQLRSSNQKLYKYDWIWKKTTVDGFFNAQCRPLKTIEMISVFSKSEARAKGNNMRYYPQGLIAVNKECKESRLQGESDGHKYFRDSIAQKSYTQKFTNYPTEILEYARDSKKVHPTQKPVALLEYLIKTYTQEGDLILDNCMGSGSTIVAAINTSRSYIGIEKDKRYYDIAVKRIAEATERKRIC